MGGQDEVGRVEWMDVRELIDTHCHLPRYLVTQLPGVQVQPLLEGLVTL